LDPREIEMGPKARPATPTSRRQHWDAIYRAKADEELGWHQDEPALSLQLIREVASPGSRIIDVGGGSSRLAGRLAEAGFRNVAVLDIARAALERSKRGARPHREHIRWIVADVTRLDEVGPFDVWHDRAVFHFLVDPEDRTRYVELAKRTVPVGGHLVVATFALEGPETCSGLPVERYDASKLEAAFQPRFTIRRTVDELHTTPWGTRQPFTYAVFERTG
jgi:2-polyprenyl-3-methyl-5-hydroxy-6-metoxy-1,4-benzoquinol methylase